MSQIGREPLARRWGRVLRRLASGYLGRPAPPPELVFGRGPEAEIPDEHIAVVDRPPRRGPDSADLR